MSVGDPTLAARLADALAAKDVSQAELARRLARADGTKPDTKRRWLLKVLAGKTYPRAASLDAIEAALQLERGYFPRHARVTRAAQIDRLGSLEERLAHVETRQESGIRAMQEQLRRGCVKSHTPLERMMMNQKLTAIVATCGLFFAAGAVATAAAPWRVFASGSDSGDYSTFASANADVIAPKALAVRTTHTADVSWSIICSGKTTGAAAGTVVVADVALAQTCTLDGSAITHSGGKVTVQLLRR